ncbi:MAG: hypothetical protein ABIK32_04630 [Chloroflexota bacterium]
MKIPNKIERLLAHENVVDVFETFEREDLIKAEDIVIISTSGDVIAVHYGSLDSRAAIGLMMQGVNLLVGGNENDN